jgi:hypothetical protein
MPRTKRRLPAKRAALSLAWMATCGGLGAASACTNFDRFERIEDVRVLAIRTEPAEILYSPFFLTPAAQRPPAFPLPTVDVDVEVFAFDPRGGQASLSRQLCPAGAGDSTCRLYDIEQDLLAQTPEARAELEPLLVPQIVESEIDTETNRLGRIEPFRFRWRLTPAVIDFFIPDDSRGNPIPSIFPLLPRVVVEAKNLDAIARNKEAGLTKPEEAEVEKERAFKRIPVALDLTSAELPPGVAADFARAFGFELCAEPIPPAVHDEQGRATCLMPRAPNENPPLAGLFLEGDAQNLTKGTLTTDVAPPDLGLESLLRATPGSSITITPVFEPEPAERYQVVSFDVEASRVILLNRVEDLVCTWYSTRGGLSHAETALQFEPGFGISWTLPTNALPGERDALLLVVLDQRGGTAVAQISVEYR